jgi:hypothetical protein
MIIEGMGIPVRLNKKPKKPQITARIGPNTLFVLKKAPVRERAKITGISKCIGTRVNWASTLAPGRLMSRRAKFARYRLPITVQTKTGCSTINMGPGCKPHMVSPISIIADAAVPGIPKANIGRYAPMTELLLAASGDATPSGAPWPNFSGCLEMAFSKL